MKNAFRWRLTCLFIGVATAACSGEEAEPGVSAAQVVADYATLVEASYADSLAGVVALHTSVHELTSEPSQANLKASRDAWLAARDPYGETEAFRFYEGPIDNADDGPEGLINAWPMDESYIDYVVDDKGAIVSGGIINMPEEYPDIDEDTLIGLNEGEGETTISTGYHAIEFLLWGQDLSDDGPGDRPYTDYVNGDEGTNENQDRRSRYLLTAADLLIENLTQVHEQWKDGEPNFRADFVALEPNEAIGMMLLGMGSLSGAELAGERMTPAVEDKEQENEHSCFSDNTKADLHNNATSVQNVLLGRYRDFDGVGIDELVEAKDSTLAQKLRDQIQQAVDDIDAIPAPFDQAILGDEDSEGPASVLAAIRSLQTFTKTLEDAAVLLDIPLELE